MLETTKYMRKPFYIDALQVNEENLEAVAEWCGGVVNVQSAQEETKFIRVEVRHPLNSRQTKAFPGDWVLHFNGGFKVYTDTAFKNNFVLHVESDSKVD